MTYKNILFACLVVGSCFMSSFAKAASAAVAPKGIFDEYPETISFKMNDTSCSYYDVTLEFKKNELISQIKKINKRYGSKISPELYPVLYFVCRWIPIKDPFDVLQYMYKRRDHCICLPCSVFICYSRVEVKFMLTRGSVGGIERFTELVKKVLKEENRISGNGRSYDKDELRNMAKWVHRVYGKHIKLESERGQIYTYLICYCEDEDIDALLKKEGHEEDALYFKGGEISLSDYAKYYLSGWDDLIEFVSQNYLGQLGFRY